VTVPLTEAEKAAAQALSRVAIANGFRLREVRNDMARAVVAAVEPHLSIAALERTVTAIEQFAARKERAGHRRDAIGINEAAELVLDELRTLRAAAQSLSRPTSEETQNR